MRGKFAPKFFVGILILLPLLVLALSWIVMTLWNYALVPTVGVGVLNLWQAMAILVLSKILFTGIKPRPKGYQNGPPWNKWKRMTDEDRERFKQRWKEHCERREQNG